MKGFSALEQDKPVWEETTQETRFVILQGKGIILITNAVILYNTTGFNTLAFFFFFLLKHDTFLECLSLERNAFGIN